MDKIYVISIILLSMIILPVFSATAFAQSQPVPVLPSLPGYKPKVQVTVNIGGEENTLNGSIEYDVTFPENMSGQVTGNGKLVFNESNLYFTLTSKGTFQAVYGSSSPSTSNMNADGYIKGNISGNADRLDGMLHLVFNFNAGQVNMNYNVPLTITVLNQPNKTITKLYTDNAVVNVMGNQSQMTANYTSIAEPDKITSHVYIKAEANNIQALYATIMPILALSGTTTLPQPQFGPNGKVYIEYQNTTVRKFNETEQELANQFRKLLEKYNVSIERVNGSIDGNFNATSTGNTFTAKFNLDAYLLVKGNFSKGVPLDPEANTILRKILATLTIDTVGDKVIVKGVGNGLFDAIDPYLVQGFFNTQVPRLLMDATSDSYAKIITHDGIKLVLNNNTYTQLVFTPQNASEARKLRLMVNGTVLEPITEPDVMVYEQYEHTNKAYIAVTNNTKMAVVKLTTANATEIRFYAPPSDKKIRVEFKNKTIEIEFSSNARIAGRNMTIERARKLLRGETPIPDTYKKLSDYYYIETTLEAGSVKVKLPFNTSMLKEGEEIYVAHWVNSKWEFIKPVEVNKTQGYVEVQLTHLSPLAVVAEKTAPTTTTTTTTRTTTTSPTTTTTQTTTTATTTSTTTVTTTQTTTTTSTQTTTSPTTTTTTTTATTQPTTTTTTKTTTTQSTSTTTATTTTTSPTTTTAQTTSTKTTSSTTKTTSTPTTTTPTSSTTSQSTSKPTSATQPTTPSPTTTQTTTTPAQGGGISTILIAAIIAVIVIIAIAGVFFMKKK